MSSLKLAEDREDHQRNGNRIEDFRPDPLGREVQSVVESYGGNVHEVADRLAIERSPEDVVPRAFRPLKKKRAELEAQLAALRKEEEHHMAKRREFCNLHDERRQQCQVVLDNQARLEGAEKRKAGFKSDFAFSSSKTGQDVQLRARCKEDYADEVILRETPDCIKAEKAKLAAITKRIEELHPLYSLPDETLSHD